MTVKDLERKGVILTPKLTYKSSAPWTLRPWQPLRPIKLSCCVTLRLEHHSPATLAARKPYTGCRV